MDPTSFPLERNIQQVRVERIRLWLESYGSGQQGSWLMRGFEEESVRRYVVIIRSVLRSLSKSLRGGIDSMAGRNVELTERAIFLPLTAKVKKGECGCCDFLRCASLTWISRIIGASSWPFFVPFMTDHRAQAEE
jgi:hypothetical protein